MASYGNTLSELKSNVEQAYADFYELAVDLKEDYVVNLEKKPDFTYLLNLKNIFHLLPDVKVSNIANKANINPSLLRQYKTGKAKASEERKKSIKCHARTRERVVVRVFLIFTVSYFGCSRNRIMHFAIRGVYKNPLVQRYGLRGRRQTVW